MNVGEILEWAVKKLEEPRSSVGSGRVNLAVLDAEVLLCEVLGKDKAWLYANKQGAINNKQRFKYKRFIRRRNKGEPVAYIVGHKEFYGLDFIVNKNVLVPRPETELLVEETIKKCQGSKGPESKISKIIEIGTGSGCVIISIIKNQLAKSKIKYIATDISNEALEVAKQNAEKHGVKNRIRFIRSDLLENKEILDPGFRRDDKWILVANLPYLDIGMKNLLDSSEVRGLKFEPSIALYGGQDGLNVYGRLLKQIKNLKNKPKYFLFEIGHNQVEILSKFMKDLGFKDFEFKKDLAGRDRVGIIKL